MKTSTEPQPEKRGNSSPKRIGALGGAAFLMATSAIGPGFLNNTSLFTQQLMTSFGFVIAVSILIDIAAQLNIWRIVAVSGLRAQDLANRVLPGLGYLLSALVVFGGLAFNTGNLAGCGLGWELLTGTDTRIGVILSVLFALFLFYSRDAGRRMDIVVKCLGLAMIGLTVYIMLASSPPYGKALAHTFWPEKTDALMIVTLVGGTVGGYISFAGAHRLLDAGVKGAASVQQVSRSAITGILVTSLMRYLLFLAALGVVMGSVTLSSRNPAASVFGSAAGPAGQWFFGLVLWLAAISSVIGASYTSVSFISSFHPSMEKNRRGLTTIFLLVSALALLLLREPPSSVLVMAGMLNGLVLPLALGILLLGLRRKEQMGTYRHPFWLHAAGWVVVAIMSWMGILGIGQYVNRL